VKIKLYLLGFLFAMSCPAFSFADPVSMSIQPNGQGSFVLIGENVNGVQSLDIEIDYDASQLENPSIQIGGGDLKQKKADSPGKLLVSIFRPVADGILQIILNFEAKTNAAGGIYNVSANATSMAPQPTEQPDADPGVSSEATENEPMNTSANGIANGTTNGSTNGSTNGTSIPSSSTAEGEAVPNVKAVFVPRTDKGIDTLSARTGAMLPAGADKKVHTEEMTVLMRGEKSVLLRFKEFKGEKGLKSFAALFGQSDGDMSVQEPAIAISDGKTPVTIRLEVPQEGMHCVGVALADARLISKKADGKEIIITVLPSEGTWDASLVIETGREILYYPLVVAPPISLAGGINANNFLDALQAYINKQSSALQGENKMYLSEYIFTANYLADLNRKTREFVP